MAGQDFANLQAPTPEDVRPMSQARLLFLVLLALAVVAGGFAIGFMLGQEIGEEKASSEEKERLVKQLKLQQEELARLRAESKKRLPQVSTTEVGELTFYNELPRQSVNPEPLSSDTSNVSSTVSASQEVDAGISEGASQAAPDKATNTSETLLKQILQRELAENGAEKGNSPTSGEHYYLQLASFQKRGDADKFYPTLGEAGFTGVVKQVELPGRGEWYRVYAGPYTSQALAEKAKQKAKSKLKITGLVVKGD